MRNPASLVATSLSSRLDSYAFWYVYDLGAISRLRRLAPVWRVTCIKRFL